MKNKTLGENSFLLNCCLSAEGDGAQHFPARLPSACCFSSAPVPHGKPAGTHQGKKKFRPAREKSL